MFREYFNDSTSINSTDRVCICDNNYNGDTAPGSPSYMCFAYKMFDVSGTIVPNCNNYVSGSDKSVCDMCNADAESSQCNVPPEAGLPQDRKCIRKYCTWQGDRVNGECQNIDGPPQPSPYNPPGPPGPPGPPVPPIPPSPPGPPIPPVPPIPPSPPGPPIPPAPPSPAPQPSCSKLNGNVIGCGSRFDCEYCPINNGCYKKGKDYNTNCAPPPSCPDLSGNEAACSSRPDCQFCSVNNGCYLKGSNDFFNTCLPASFSPEQSTAAAKQKQSALLREIRTIVHNEVASELGRTTANSQPFYQLETKGNAIVSSDPSLLQGRELESAKRPTWCPKNMDDYIRKDSIPCYGCNLGY